MATYYVTTSGSDSNNGLTEGTAFATPGYAAGQATTSGDIVYVKEGTYTLTSTSANVSGGTLSISQSVRFEGYKTTIGDTAARPVIHAGTQVVTNVIYFDNPLFNRRQTAAISIEVDGNGNATNGFYQRVNYNSVVYDCIARNCTNGFYGGQQNGFNYGCAAYDCTGYGFHGGSPIYCLAEGCLYGFGGPSASNTILEVFGCIAANCTGTGFNLNNALGSAIYKCIAYGNGGEGFFVNYDVCQHHQCISVNNSGYGYRIYGGSGADAFMTDCADYNNANGRLNNTLSAQTDFRPINLTGDPFTSASTGDFTLNNNAGAGAELRQIQLSGLAGVNSVFDVGAIDAVVTPGGGGSTHPLAASTFHPLAH